MALGNADPTTPSRNRSDAHLLSAWSRSKLPTLPPGLPPRRVVLPADAPPNTPNTTDRIRRLSVKPTFPVYVPTQPAAMRRAQEVQQAQQIQQTKQQVLTPRRRVVPNVLPDEPTQPFTPTPPRLKSTAPPPTTPKTNPKPAPPPPPPSPSAAPPSEDSLPCPCLSPVPNPAAKKAAALAKLMRYDGGRYINANTYGVAPNGHPTVTNTELIHYPEAQQKADYAALLADSIPEETWESRRKAPMVPPAHTWLNSDSFAQEWYDAVVSSYKQDVETGEQLGGTAEEQEREKRLKAEGHLTGVSVSLELKRHDFEADLLRRARDSILRDNGIMPRSALNGPDVNGGSGVWNGWFHDPEDMDDDEELCDVARAMRARIAVKDGRVFWKDRRAWYHGDSE